MKALRRHAREAKAASIQDVPKPEVRDPHDVLIDVAFCGICGSDLHAYMNHAGYEWVLPEVTFGHELSGTVAEVGQAVTSVKVGDHVTVEAIQSHMTGDQLRNGLTQLASDRQVHGLHHDGGMAQFTVAHERFVLPLPEGLDMRTAALTEPMSIADHCVYQRMNVNPGDKVVVTGPGIIGMLSALVARHRGAEVIISGTAADEEVRLSAARRIGLGTAIVGPDQPSLRDQVLEQWGSEADALIEASGAPPALAWAWDVVRTDSVITVVSIFGRNVDLDFTKFIRKQIDVRTSYGSNRANFEHSLKLLNDGVVPTDELVKTYPLEEGIQGFTDAENQAVMKPILDCA